MIDFERIISVMPLLAAIGLVTFLSLQYAFFLQVEAYEEINGDNSVREFFNIIRSSSDDEDEAASRRSSKDTTPNIS